MPDKAVLALVMLDDKAAMASAHREVGKVRPLLLLWQTLLVLPKPGAKITTSLRCKNATLILGNTAFAPCLAWREKFVAGASGLRDEPTSPVTLEELTINSIAAGEALADGEGVLLGEVDGVVVVLAEPEGVTLLLGEPDTVALADAEGVDGRVLIEAKAEADGRYDGLGLLPEGFVVLVLLLPPSAAKEAPVLVAAAARSRRT